MTDPGAPRELAAEVADALSRALAPVGEDLVAWTARTARAVFGAAACSIALLSEDGSELVFTTASGGAANNVSGLRLPSGEGIAGWVATTGQPLAVSDLQRDPRFATQVASSTGYMPEAILASPIEINGRLIGVIEILDRDSSRAGSDDDLALLALFAHQAALALDAAERSRRIGALILAALDGASADNLPDLLRAQPASEDGLADVAAAFAELAGAGDAERALATAVLRDVGRFARRGRR